MKAITLDQYGSTKNLRIRELKQPTAKKNHILIKVKATAVNDYDWAMVTGKPLLYRLMFGLFKPKNPILGMELSGIVEELGAGVKKFKIGDRVYGDISEFTFGTFAEYIEVHEDAVLAMPENLTFEEAATVPHACMLAVQALKDIAQIDARQTLLVNGAGGGVGAFAAQYAKHLGIHATGVDTLEKKQSMLDIGFDETIDYRVEDFTQRSNAYDVILDAKTNRPFWHYYAPLKAGGLYVTVGGSLPNLLQILIFGLFFSRFSKKSLRILALKANKGLEEIAPLLNNKTLRCPIDGPYPFSEAQNAVQRFGDANHKGKIIICP